MKKTAKIAALLLACVLLLSAVPAFAAEEPKFSDVPEDAWYGTYLDKILWAQQVIGADNIITGFPDGSFKPGDNVKRGEFLKMIFEAAMSAGNDVSLASNAAQSGTHWAGKYYTKAEADNILVADPYASGSGVDVIFPCTWDALEQPITRYEMAVILNNVCTNIDRQPTVTVHEPQDHITDYAELETRFVSAVEQSYAKGLLTGDENFRFNGASNLTRAEAVTVLYRFLFVEWKEALADWAEVPVAASGVTERPAGFVSFAEWLQQGHVDAYGNLDAEARMHLFGNANKTCFTSAADAAGHMTSVSVPIWTVDKAGNKYSSAISITVNKAVADEVRLIFQQIYNDPEQFPIYGGWSAGGARYTDTLRHSWGCAIDVNALYNCECDFRGSGGRLRVTCGYGWWPIGHSDTAYSGSLSAQSQYSIGSKPGEYGYSVVKAFADYGWGWGGKGYSSGKHDFMHFSVMPSGG